MILYLSADATREALKAITGQASPRRSVGLPALTCMLLQGKERERATYFLRPGVHRFLALSMGLVVGRFVPLAFIAFFLWRTSTPKEEEEQETDEEEEEVLASLEDAELSLPLDESESAVDPDSAKLASSCGFHSQSEQPSKASQQDVASLSTACATFKVIFSFITTDIFLARSCFVRIIPANYNPFRQIKGVQWHRGMAPCQVSFDV